MAGRAGGTLILRTIASAEPSLHDVVGDRGSGLTARESELAEIAVPLEDEGADGTPRGCAIEGAAHIVLVLQLPAVPPDGLMHRRSHRNGGHSARFREQGVAACAGNELPEDRHLKRLVGPAVK
jgi:hypothetical protein